MTLKQLKTYIDETLKVLPEAGDSEVVIPIEGGYYNAHIALDGLLFQFQPQIKQIFLHTNDDIPKNDIEGYEPSSPMQLVELNGLTVIVRDHILNKKGTEDE